jgi:hypothetical protein
MTEKFKGDFDGMTIIRTRHLRGGRGYAPSIELDPTWDELTKLRWHAAAVTAYCKHKIVIEVEDADFTIDNERHWGYFNVRIKNSVAGPMRYRSAWNHINGVFAGVRAMGVGIK